MWEEQLAKEHKDHPEGGKERRPDHPGALSAAENGDEARDA